MGSSPSRRTEGRCQKGTDRVEGTPWRTPTADATPGTDGSVLAYVDESGTYDHVLRTARTLAKEHAARLILYHSIATPGEPIRIPDAGSDAAPLPQPLSSAQDLRGAARPLLAAAVEEARDDGIDAWGWLTPEPGVGPLMRYAEQVDAEVVVLPAELGRPRRLRATSRRAAPGRARDAER